MTVLKSAIALSFACAVLAPAAYAGPGKDCGEKKARSTQASATTAPTQVLSTSDTAETKMQKVKMEKKAKKALTFDEALAVCQKKGVDDLQACIDYKTEKTTPKS